MTKPIKARATNATEEAQLRAHYAGYAVRRSVLGTGSILLTFTKI